MKFNVMLVDDSISVLESLQWIFKDDSYYLFSFNNPFDALSVIKTLEWAAVVADRSMQKMDGLEFLKRVREYSPCTMGIIMTGYQVCEALKADTRLKDVPVIFISALDEVTDKVKEFSAGGVDYISKPFQTEEVLARVETHLKLRNLRKELEDKNVRLQKTNEELQRALDEIKILRSILPICSHCKKIRNDDDSWHAIESYISNHSDGQFSHGICPDCFAKHHSDLKIYDD